MKMLLDMVHHNPGEEPFASAYLDPSHLVSLGYDGQVLKHINPNPDDPPWRGDRGGLRRLVAGASRWGMATWEPFEDAPIDF